MPLKINVPFLNFGQKKGESRTFQPIFHQFHRASVITTIYTDKKHLTGEAPVR